MRGIIKELYLYEANKKPYGFIMGDDGGKYYFNQQTINEQIQELTKAARQR